jgi:cyclopropane-fatty-acyl-phospholipid synthase
MLDPILRRMVRHGRLTVRTPDGRVTAYGPGGPPTAAVHVRDAATLRRLVLNPALALGEAYMDGGVVPEDGTIRDVLDVLLANTRTGPGHPVLRLRGWVARQLRWLQQRNPIAASRRRVAHHYDLNGRLYALFLDRDRQYSCAYFARPDMTLEEAQAAKKRLIAAKLLLDRPGLTVLDIGCGWGGLALTLAREHGARVLGITLSAEQLQVARARAGEAGLGDRVSFALRDYRQVEGRFDRVVSVGMFEHVGVPHHRRFFATVRDRLAEDGIALIHAIGRPEGPGSTNPWLRKYIFPGGYSPALSEVMAAVEPSGLFVTDIEILRLHYAETIRHWQQRFQGNRDAIASLYDERFCRMFEFYLAGVELAFRREGHFVWHLQLAHRQDAVPLTRDYLLRQRTTQLSP